MNKKLFLLTSIIPAFCLTSCKGFVVYLETAKEILENFDNVKEQFENFSVSDFIQINSSVFNYLEYEFSKEHKILDKNYDFENRTAENLNRYFDFLEKSNKKEIQTQFVNLCNAEKFPNALVFIAEKS